MHGRDDNILFMPDRLRKLREFVAKATDDIAKSHNIIYGKRTLYPTANREERYIPKTPYLKKKAGYNRINTTTTANPPTKRHYQTEEDHMFRLNNLLTRFSSLVLRDTIDPHKQDKFVQNLERSTRRTRSTIAAIIKNNDFEHWVTFTFNCEKCENGCLSRGQRGYKCICTPENCSKYDDAAMEKRLMLWFKSYKRKYPDLEWLIVPERHKTGVLHFHGFLKNFPPTELVQAKDLKTGKNLFNYGKPVMNFRVNKLGLCRIETIASSEAVSNYCRKYIYKGMATMTGKKRYWRSRGLKMPVTHDLIEDTRALELQLDQFPLSIHESPQGFTIKLPIEPLSITETNKLQHAMKTRSRARVGSTSENHH